MVLVQKWPFLQFFFLGKIGKGKCLLRHSRTKKCLPRLKKKKFKKSKNCHFSKGVNPWFLDKNDLFGNFFFFQANQERKMCFAIFQNEKKPFWAIKTRSSKSQRIAISPKGLAHGFGTKMAIFLIFFFFSKQAMKMSFTIFQNEKKCLLQAIKTTRSKSGKIDIFQQGLTHGFGPKMAIFSTSFFLAIQARKMCFTIFQNEGTPFQASKTRSSKNPKNCHFSNGVNPWFCSKNIHFFNVFWRGKTGHENVFQDILARKNTFLGFTNKEIKTSKNCHFSKKVNPWFWSKNGHFFNFFFLGKIGQENMFYDILERKNAFLGYKNKTLKKSKNCYFSKGVNPLFLDKNGLFGNFFLLGKIGLENVFYYNLEPKNAFLRSKKKSSKSRKIAIFSKGLTHGFCPKMAIFPTSFF